MCSLGVISSLSVQATGLKKTHQKVKFVFIISSPEISYKLDGAGKSWLTHHHTRLLSEAILAGFALTVMEKDLPRMGASTPDQTHEMLNRTKSQIFPVGHADRSVPSDPPDQSFPVVHDGQRIAEAGNDFNIPVEPLPKLS